MNSNRLVERFFGQPELDSDCKALHNLPGVRACIVQTQYFVCPGIYYCLCIHFYLIVIAFLSVFLKRRFFQGLVLDMVDRNILSSMNFNCFLFSRPTQTVFYRRKYRSWIILQRYKHLVLLELPQIINPMGKPAPEMLPHFYSSRCQLRQTFNNITQSIDVVHIGSFNFVG